MPVVGPPVQVTVTPSPMGGSLVVVSNRTGSRRRFDVAGEAVLVDGNTRVVLVLEVDPVDVVVSDGVRRLWPVIE